MRGLALLPLLLPLLVTAQRRQGDEELRYYRPETRSPDPVVEVSAPRTARKPNEFKAPPGLPTQTRSMPRPTYYPKTRSMPRQQFYYPQQPPTYTPPQPKPSTASTQRRRAQRRYPPDPQSPQTDRMYPSPPTQPVRERSYPQYPPQQTTPRRHPQESASRPRYHQEAEPQSRYPQNRSQNLRQAPTQGCEDASRDCPSWKQHCGSNDGVRAQCPLTCSLCSPGRSRSRGEVCEDTEAQCSSYAKLCGTTGFVIRNCRKTCGECGGGKRRGGSSAFPEGSRGGGRDEREEEEEKKVKTGRYVNPIHPSGRKLRASDLRRSGGASTSEERPPVSPPRSTERSGFRRVRLEDLEREQAENPEDFPPVQEERQDGGRSSERRRQYPARGQQPLRASEINQARSAQPRPAQPDDRQEQSRGGQARRAQPEDPQEQSRQNPAFRPRVREISQSFEWTGHSDTAGSSQFPPHPPFQKVGQGQSPSSHRTAGQNAGQFNTAAEAWTAETGGAARFAGQSEDGVSRLVVPIQDITRFQNAAGETVPPAGGWSTTPLQAYRKVIGPELPPGWGGDSAPTSSRASSSRQLPARQLPPRQFQSGQLPATPKNSPSPPPSSALKAGISTRPQSPRSRSESQVTLVDLDPSPPLPVRRGFDKFGRAKTPMDYVRPLTNTVDDSSRTTSSLTSLSSTRSWDRFGEAEGAAAFAAGRHRQTPPRTSSSAHRITANAALTSNPDNAKPLVELVDLAALPPIPEVEVLSRRVLQGTPSALLRMPESESRRTAALEAPEETEAPPLRPLQEPDDSHWQQLPTRPQTAGNTRWGVNSSPNVDINQYIPTWPERQIPVIVTTPPPLVVTVPATTLNTTGRRIGDVDRCVMWDDSCAHNSRPICKRTGSYTGSRQKTVDGTRCKKWADTPMKDDPISFPSNYCRSTPGWPPWCYKINSNSIWEFSTCFPECPELKFSFELNSFNKTDSR